MSASSQSQFTWPPAPMNDAPKPTPRPAIAADSPTTRAADFRATLRACESFWLAPTAVPIRRRMIEIGWSPDALGAYCDRCGMTVGPFEADDFGCADCRGEPVPWSRFVRLGAYDGELAEWIIDLKFRGRRNVASDLGVRLAHAARHAGLPSAHVAVVPVAMARSRRFFRPFDHALEIARPVARALDVPLVHAFRRKRRPSQRTVPASRRRANVRGSFLPRRGVDFTGWTALVIDDVRTTGATLAEASRTLRRMGATEIWTAVVAVTPSRSRREPAGTNT